MAIQAILTGDIVNSTRLSRAEEKKLIDTLQKVFSGHQIEFYRGDSFQAYVKQPKSALGLALLCRTAAIGLSSNEEMVSSDIRISIGIGTIKTPVRQMRTAKGDAFILSGRAFEEIEGTGVRLAIATTHPLANAGLQAIADHINAILEQMTSKQAQVIFELLKGQTQRMVAKKLRKTKSTIHQHVVAGRWPEIERILQRYENIINQLT
jgi:hypothetical protein